MKKLILLSISVFLGLQLAVNSSAKAQNFNIVASFGSTQNWGVPTAIMYEVDYFYPYHRFVHVNRQVRGRQVFFNVLLERYGEFVELTVSRNGSIINSNYFNNYPLVNHVCSAYCGYHSDYYFQQQVACNSHHHNGHNHTNYYQQPRYNRYARPNSVRVVYNNGHHGSHGNNGYHGKNGHYKKHKNGRNDQHNDHSRNGAISRDNNSRPSSSQVKPGSRSVNTSNDRYANNDRRTDNVRSSSSNSRGSSSSRSTSPSSRSTSSSRGESSSRSSRN